MAEKIAAITADEAITKMREQDVPLEAALQIGVDLDAVKKALIFNGQMAQMGMTTIGELDKFAYFVLRYLGHLENDSA